MPIFNESSADAYQDRLDEANHEYVEDNKEDIAEEYLSDDDNLRKYLKTYLKNVKKVIEEIEAERGK